MAAAHDNKDEVVRAFNSISTAKWDGVADSLRTNGGVATIDFFPRDICSRHCACFETACRGLDVAKRTQDGDTSSTMKRIGPNDDSAHATGYHCAGSDGSSMSRYNSYREGFVFSDGAIFDVDLGENGNEKRKGEKIFQSDMETFFASMHDAIAVNVLRAIARNLGCQDEDWFQSKLGPTNESSQWHVKRYVCPSAAGIEKNECSECNGNGDAEEEFEWLPVHTDPSLISIVLHDVPGKREGAMGLQYQAPDPSISSYNDSNPKSKTKVWVDVPFHGHAVATVFVGSVLSYITGNLYPGAKHRVVYRPPASIDECDRVAATLFVRPRGDCKLLVPPSPLLLDAEGNSSVRIRNTTFDAWLARVSRNYMKGRKNE